MTSLRRTSLRRTCSGVRRLVLINSTGNISGAEVVLCALIELAHSRGLEVVLACPSGPLVQRLPVGVRHVELPAMGLDGGTGKVGRGIAGARLGVRYLRAARLLATEVRQPGTRTVVNSLLALPAARLARPHGGACWLVHDTVHQTKQRLIVQLSRGQLRGAVAVSEATAVPLRQLQLHVIVAHNGVRWPVDPAALTVGDPPVVGMLALLTPWKGQQVLLEAVARLPELRLELAGGSFPHDADYVAALKARSERPDLRGRVRFLGHVDSLSTMRGWDLAVSASTSPEAGPISVLEAMSLGVPVVGTDHGGTVEFLSDGAGLLVPSGEIDALVAALRRGLSDMDFRTKASAAGRSSVAARHDLAQTLPAMLDALVDDPHARRSGPLRALFINENIGGHVTVHSALRRCLADRTDIEAEFLDVPDPKLLGRILRLPVPVLSRHDLDLQPLRSQLVRSYWLRRALARRLRGGGIDVVHVYTQNCALTSAAQLRSLPSVITTDSTTELNAYRIPYRRPTRFTPWSVRVSKLFEQPVLDAADRVIANSEFVAESMREGYGLTADRLEVLPFGVWLPPAPLPRPDRRPTIVFVGHHLERKGGLRLIDVHQRHLRDRCELVIVTTEKLPELPGVRVVSDLRGGSDRLWAVLQAADIMCFPSTMDQAPNAVLEGAAAGLPVIAHPVAAVGEMVKHGETGLLVAPDDDAALLRALTELLDDPDRRHEMGRRARRHIEENYDMRVAADHLVDVLARVAGLGRGTTRSP